MAMFWKARRWLKSLVISWDLSGDFAARLQVAFLILLLTYLLTRSDPAPRIDHPIPTVPTQVTSSTITKVPTLTSVTGPLSTLTPTFTLTPPWDLALDLYFNTLPSPLMKDASEWTISEDGVKFVSFWEGYVGHLYDDGGQPGVGNCTIGYGHLIHLGPCNGAASEAQWAGGISQAAALMMLEKELTHCGSYVAEYVEVPLTQAQYNILSGLVCGWGYGKFSQSEVLQLLNQGYYVAAAQRLKTTAIYGIGIGLCPGLVRRRAVEAEMFLKPHGYIMWPFIEKQ